MEESTSRIDLQETVTQGGDPYLADIRKEWDWVSEGVREILERTPQLTFRQEDVYAACVNGQALLWITSEGFVVTTVEVDRFTEDRTLLVWLAWARHRGEKKAAYYLPFFEKQARKAGLQKMEVRSAVRQMIDYLESDGWLLDHIVYTRDV